MCTYCNYYIIKHKNYNYCPNCGNKLKDVAFIPKANMKLIKMQSDLVLENCFNNRNKGRLI